MMNTRMTADLPQTEQRRLPLALDAILALTLLVLWAVYYSTLLCYGLDLTDFGHSIANISYVISDFEYVSRTAATAGSWLLGALMVKLIPHDGIISYRIIGLVILLLITVVTYFSLGYLVKVRSIRMLLSLLPVVLIYKSATTVNYNTASALFIALTLLSLINSDKNIRWLFFAGLFVQLGVFCRVPNALQIPFVLLFIMFQTWYDGKLRTRVWKDILYFLAGILASTVLLIAYLLIAGDLSTYYAGMFLLKDLGESYSSYAIVARFWIDMYIYVPSLMVFVIALFFLHVQLRIKDDRLHASIAGAIPYALAAAFYVLLAYITLVDSVEVVINTYHFLPVPVLALLLIQGSHFKITAVLAIGIMSAFIYPIGSNNPHDFLIEYGSAIPAGIAALAIFTNAFNLPHKSLFLARMLLIGSLVIILFIGLYQDYTMYVRDAGRAALTVQPEVVYANHIYTTTARADQLENAAQIVETYNLSDKFVLFIGDVPIYHYLFRTSVPMHNVWPRTYSSSLELILQDYYEEHDLDPILVNKNPYTGRGERALVTIHKFIEYHRYEEVYSGEFHELYLPVAAAEADELEN